MKLSLKWLFPAVALLVTMLWLVVPKLSSASKNGALEAQFNDLGIISQSGIVPSADLTLADINGQRSSLAAFQGKIVLLNLWATWCPECANEMPALENLQNQLGRDDFAVVAIDLREAREAVAAFVQEHHLTFKILLDPEGRIGQALNIRSIPTTYILSRKGELIGKVLGARDWDDTHFINLFRALIEARKPPAASTTSIPAGTDQGPGDGSKKVASLTH